MRAAAPGCERVTWIYRTSGSTGWCRKNHAVRTFHRIFFFVLTSIFSQSPKSRPPTRSQQPSFTSAASPNITPDAASGLPFALDPNTAKQMAALQATSLAKVANRSAPGGVTSASYFGGLSNHQLSRLDASSTTELNNFSPSLQQGPQAQAVPTNVNPPTLRVYAAY